MINQSPWKINKQMNCGSYNLVYEIICSKDVMHLDWKNKEVAMIQISRLPLLCTKKHPNKSMGKHFNFPGHSLADLSVKIIERTTRGLTEYRKERDTYFITKFCTLFL